MSEFDDLSVGLAHASSKPWFSRTTLALGGLVLLVAGFLVGLHVAPTSASPSPASFNRPDGYAQLGGQGFPGRTDAGSGTPARNATTGKIKLVNGSTVYVELADGSIVTVKLSNTTKVLTSASVKDLKAGSEVTVQGETGSDGTITAGSITRTK